MISLILIYVWLKAGSIQEWNDGLLRLILIYVWLKDVICLCVKRCNIGLILIYVWLKVLRETPYKYIYKFNFNICMVKRHYELNKSGVSVRV